MNVVSLPLTVRGLRAEIASAFAAAGIENPYDEARDIIAAVLEQPRFWAAAHADEQIDGDAIRAAAQRRVMGMPFAYAVGRAAFRHLTLNVDKRVLIPRQETEYLVDLVLRATGGHGVVADVGTGSGCIALALASEGSFHSVIATDESEDALAVARVNAAELELPHAPLEMRCGDLCTTLSERDKITAIVSNPPYIAPDEMRQLPASVSDWEPQSALVSSNGGLAHTFSVIADAPRVLRRGGLLALEVDSRRAQRVAAHARQNAAFSGADVHKDFTGRERYVLAHIR